jgi:hypothetical protein
MGRGAAALASDDVRRFLGGGLVDVDADDMRAVGGEQGGGRLAVAPTWTDGSSSEDNGNLVLQPFRHGVTPGSIR